MSKPIKRPTSGETEEDLLKLQAEFMKQKQDCIKKDVVDIETRMDLDSPSAVNRKRKISKEVKFMKFISTPRARGWYQHINFDVVLGVRHFKEVSLTRFSS